MFRKEIITTAEDYRQLVYFTEFQLKRYPTVIMIIAAALSVAALVIGLIGIIPLLVSLAVCIVCVGVTAFFPLKAAKKAKDGAKYGKVALNAKRTLEYDGVSIRIYGGRTNTDINAPWQTVFAIYELESCFIVYLTFDKAFCISKNQLTVQETVDMRNYFEKKMQERFYLKCKR